ncbi:MAG TPA: hypothetical protein VFL85_03765, partial [Candidatus Saccharimonadales bacterium]|nr:hypothetical protein [Candidatus Saccharimonadales bacterium]
MKSKSNFVLPDSVTSPQDITGLQLEIRDYARWFSHNAVKKQLHAGRVDTAPELSPQARDLLREWSTAGPLSVKSLGKNMRALEDYARTAPHLTITLAAPAPASLKQTL